MFSYFNNIDETLDPYKDPIQYSDLIIYYSDFPKYLKTPESKKEKNKKREQHGPI